WARRTAAARSSSRCGWSAATSPIESPVACDARNCTSRPVAAAPYAPRPQQDANDDARMRVIVNLIYPSSHHRTAGVVVLYEIANGLARRGHEVHFNHGPWWAERIESVDELTHFAFEPNVQHHIVDTVEDAHMVDGDVVLHPKAPRRLGEPVVIVQGFRM